MLVPSDWNWEAYLLINPDVSKISCSENFAIQHWDRFGRREGRSYQKTKIEHSPYWSQNYSDNLSKEIALRNFLGLKEDKGRHYNIAIFFHLGNYNLWSYFRNVIDIVQQSTHKSIDLYVTYQVVNHEIHQQIKQLYPNVILLESLRGVDVGGQLLMIAKAIELGKNYDYVLKLHTKSNVNWRATLVEPLTRNTNRLQQIYTIFEGNPNIGLIGSSRWICPFGPNNTPLMEQICSRLGLICDHKTQRFLSGTIFWFRWDTMVQAIKKYKIDLIKEYNTMELGYKKNVKPTFTHSWERILSILILNMNSILYGMN